MYDATVWISLSGTDNVWCTISPSTYILAKTDPPCSAISVQQLSYLFALPVVIHCAPIKSSPFLPRCMECRRGLAMRILSVCHTRELWQKGRVLWELSVRPSVRLSVTRVLCDKTVERSVQIYIPYERTFTLVFWEDRMVGGGRPLLPEILGQPTPIGTKAPIFNQ